MNKNRFYIVIRSIIKPFFYLIYRMKYIGRENVPSIGAYILASNHMHSVDPILIGCGIKRPVMFMAKAELFKSRFMRWLLNHLGAFPVDRGKNDRNAINHFEEVLSEGNLMGIFIEGTRSKTGEFLQPKNGASLISYDTKTPVIPVCISKDGSKRIIHYDKPLSLEQLGFVNGGAREFRNASRLIMEHIKSLREQDLSE